MRILLVLIACVSSGNAFAAFERMGGSATSASMGGAAVAVPGFAWSVFHNPAGISSLDDRMLSLSYAPQHFGLKELSHGVFSYVEPTTIGAFALSGQRFGFELYKEVALTASYASQVAERFYAGINLHYYSLSIRGYGSAGTIGCDIGLLVQLTDDIHWGASAFNVNAPSIGEAKERLPQVYATGISYTPLSEATLAVDIVKDIRYPVELRIGLEYRLLEMVHLRAGSATEPSSLNGGLGIQYGFLHLDYAVTGHPDLGLSHLFSVSFRLGDL